MDRPFSLSPQGSPQPLYGLLVQGVSSGGESAGVIICHSHRYLV